MKNLLALIVISLFTMAVACGGAPMKMDDIPTEAPTTVPAEMPTEVPTEMPATAPADDDGAADDKGEGEGEGEGEGDGDGADAPKTRALKKFDGNRMERAPDEGEGDAE